MYLIILIASAVNLTLYQLTTLNQKAYYFNKVIVV